MASDEEFVIRSRGSRPPPSEPEQGQQEVVNEQENQNNVEQQQQQQPQQQQPQESIWRTILTRIFFFWLISQFFKWRQGGNQTSQQGQNVASFNLFPTGASMVCFSVY